MSEAKQLEDQLANARVLSDKRQKMLRLLSNPEFKELIIDDFSTTECARYAHASADPNLDEHQRKDSLNIAQAAGHLKRYIAVILQMGFTAERDMDQVEDALVAARQEELNEANAALDEDDED